MILSNINRASGCRPSCNGASMRKKLRAPTITICARTLICLQSTHHFSRMKMLIGVPVNSQFSRILFSR